jgi:hypothetical protein
MVDKDDIFISEQVILIEPVLDYTVFIEDVIVGKNADDGVDNRRDEPYAHDQIMGWSGWEGKPRNHVEKDAEE